MIDIFISYKKEEKEKAQVAIVLWSMAATKSKWVLSEAQRAEKRGILISARLDDCVVPIPHDVAQVLDLPKENTNIEEGFAPLLSAVQARIGHRTPADMEAEKVERRAHRIRTELEEWQTIIANPHPSTKEYETYLEKWGEKASAQNNLGWMYEKGRGGLPQSDEKAVELWAKAAEQGDKVAIGSLKIFIVTIVQGLPQKTSSGLFKWA